MKSVIEFLDQLHKNNNRQWFDEHKNEYKEAQSVFNTFIESLISGISEFDPLVKDQTVKSCTYRIYRDVRFSKNKDPYKTHMGAFIAPHGKNGGYSGYYFHIEAKNSEYIGSNILSTGIYMPDPVVIKSIREEIILNGDQFDKVVKQAEGFALDNRSALKRVPNGYPSDFVYADYLKLKDYFLAKSVNDEYILSNNLLERTISDFKKSLPFNNWINKAAEYAYETMK